MENQERDDFNILGIFGYCLFYPSNPPLKTEKPVLKYKFQHEIAMKLKLSRFLAWKPAEGVTMKVA